MDAPVVHHGNKEFMDEKGEMNNEGVAAAGVDDQQPIWEGKPWPKGHPFPTIPSSTFPVPTLLKNLKVQDRQPPTKKHKPNRTIGAAEKMVRNRAVPPAIKKKTITFPKLPTKKTKKSGRQLEDGSSHTSGGKRQRAEPWTEEEDAALVNLIKYDPDARKGQPLGSYPDGERRIAWNRLATKMDTRSGKQCRERWTNHLDPDIKKGPWSEEEDRKVVQLHATMGNKWSTISAHIPGRSDNDVKNRWNTHLDPNRTPRDRGRPRKRKEERNDKGKKRSRNKKAKNIDRQEYEYAQSLVRKVLSEEEPGEQTLEDAAGGNAPEGAAASSTDDAPPQQDYIDEYCNAKANGALPYTVGLAEYCSAKDTVSSGAGLAEIETTPPLVWQKRGGVHSAAPPAKEAVSAKEATVASTVQKVLSAPSYTAAQLVGPATFTYTNAPATWRATSSSASMAAPDLLEIAPYNHNAAAVQEHIATVQEQYRTLIGMGPAMAMGPNGGKLDGAAVINLVEKIKAEAGASNVKVKSVHLPNTRYLSEAPICNQPSKSTEEVEKANAPAAASAPMKSESDESASAPANDELAEDEAVSLLLGLQHTLQSKSEEESHDSSAAEALRAMSKTEESEEEESEEEESHDSNTAAMFLQAMSKSQDDEEEYDSSSAEEDEVSFKKAQKAAAKPVHTLLKGGSKAAQKVSAKKVSTKKVPAKGRGKAVKVPSGKDVLGGRGGGINKHAGNVLFREETRKLKTIYKHESSRTEKHEMSKALVKRVKGYGGRFLKKGSDGLWHDMAERDAQKKACQALREDKWT